MEQTTPEPASEFEGLVGLVASLQSLLTREIVQRRCLASKVVVMEAMLLNTLREAAKSDALAPLLRAAATQTRSQVKARVNDPAEGAHPEVDAALLRALAGVAEAVGLPREGDAGGG